MIEKGRVLVCDIDGTIVNIKNKDQEYKDLEPIESVVKKIRSLKSKGWRIIFSTARNMRTYNGDIDCIEKYTLPVLIEWLDRHNIPYDEIHIGKPWCGSQGFYVDDKTVRPKEFAELNNDQIHQLLEQDRIAL